MTSRKRLLLTGASGFVGSHALRHVLVNTDWDVICPVSYAHQGLPERIGVAMSGANGEIVLDWMKRVSTVYHDLRAQPYEHSPTWASVGHVDYIWNIAAESHVDRSIDEPIPFIRSNVDLALAIAEVSRMLEPEMILHMSTDEVYGPAAPGQFHAEWDAIRPSNPYSASKACQEAILYSYWRTYGLPLVVTNTMNIIGETQAPEKYMPKVLRSVLRGEALTVHAEIKDGQKPRVGSRCWLHARNLADAWLWITEHDPVLSYSDGHSDPLRLHIVGEELSNLELAEKVAEAAGRSLEYELVDVHSTRPGHDLRYALDGEKIDRLGWKAPVSLDEGIEHIVRWTLEHPHWLG